MPAFRVRPTCPFSLATSRAFYDGFTPAAGTAAEQGEALVLSFRLERTWEAVGVALRQEANGDVTGEVVGAQDVAAAKRQALRMVSLDHDGAGWPAVGMRCPVIGELQALYPGFLPVCFASPYEAALWGLLAHRVNMKQAAALKRRLAEAHGEPVTVGGRTLHAAPAPKALLSLDAFPGIPNEKLARLKTAAQAALDGLLDAEALRATHPARALDRLSKLRGVGAWTAEHVLVRGAALADLLPTGEPRVLRAVALAYGLKPDVAPVAEYERRAEAWKPYRSWAAVLLAYHLSRSGKWAGAGTRGARPRTSPSRARSRPAR